MTPLKVGDKVGVAEILDNEGSLITNAYITVKEDVLKANLWDYFKKNFKITLFGKDII